MKKKKPEVNYDDLPDEGRNQGYYHENYPMPPPADFDTPISDSDTKDKPKLNKGGRPRDPKIEKRMNLAEVLRSGTSLSHAREVNRSEKTDAKKWTNRGDGFLKLN